MDLTPLPPLLSTALTLIVTFWLYQPLALGLEGPVLALLLGAEQSAYWGGLPLTVALIVPPHETVIIPWLLIRPLLLKVCLITEVPAMFIVPAFIKEPAPCIYRVVESFKAMIAPLLLLKVALT